MQGNGAAIKKYFLIRGRFYLALKLIKYSEKYEKTLEADRCAVI